MTVLQKEANLSHAPALLTIATMMAGRERLPPTLWTKTRRWSAQGAVLERMLRRVSVPITMVALCRALFPYATQVISETSISGEYLCRVKGNPHSLPLQSFCKEGPDGPDDPLSRQVLIVEASLPFDNKTRQTWYLNTVLIPSVITDPPSLNPLVRR